jgi:hypothetical protein
MEFLRKLFAALGESSMRNGDNPAASSRFRCVQINVNGASSCAAALEVAGKRFLPHEIPTLPMPECTAETCECSYELFSDRRRIPRIAAQSRTEQPGRRL